MTLSVGMPKALQNVAFIKKILSLPRNEKNFISNRLIFSHCVRRMRSDGVVLYQR